MASEVEETTTDRGPRELNRLEVLRGLRIATWEAAFATVWASLTSGAFLTGYALWLGANSVVMGILTSIPTFAGLIQIVSSYFGERLQARKPFAAWFFTAGRLLWLPILLLPLVMPRAIALYPFLLLYALSFVLQNVPMPAYMSWMSDLVPPDHRGRYFGRRNMIAGIVGMLIGIPAAWFLDHTTKRVHLEPLGFGTLFGVGVVGALLSFACLLRQPEPPKRAAPSTNTGGGLASIVDYYRAPFADANFRRLMLFNTVFVMGQFFAAPFYMVYALQKLHLDYVWLQVFSTLTSVASLASMPLWGYLADKFGNKPLLAVGVVGVFTLPLTWIFTTPHNPTMTLLILVELNLAGGLFWAGAGLSQFNLLISLSPPEKTPVYVATMASVTGLAGGVAPLLGSAMMHGLEGWSGTFLGIALSNYQVTFFVSALLRLTALLFLHPIVDERSASTRDMLQQLSRSGPRAWFNIRRLQRGGDMEGRLRATEALAESRTTLAVDELSKALHDPSFAVREEAVRALGEIGDPEAVEALIGTLHDPAAGLVAEAAHALGRIGDRRANAALMNLLQEEEVAYLRSDRLAAVRALGELGGPEVVEVLLNQLRTAVSETNGDEEMAETLVRALGQMGDRRATPLLVELLETPEIPRTLCVVLLRALSELGDKAAIGSVRAILAETETDPALVTLLADALARLEDTESVLPLLARLETLESPIARKQIAHAIGTLLGESETLYPLLAQEEFGRDSVVSRLIQEMQRRLKTPALSDTLNDALHAYISGEFALCLSHLATVASTQTELHTGESNPLSLCHQVLHFTPAFEGSPPIEVVLIALCALRALLSDETGR